MIAATGGFAPEALRYSCSFAQEGLYAATVRRPGDVALNASMRWRIRGELNHGILERAWNVVIARHEMLRTRFAIEGGRLQQVVETSLVAYVPIVDCSGLDRAIVESEILRIAAKDSRAPFDVARAPLWRLTRLVLDANDSVLLVTAHQLACDGWSFGLVAREIGTICAAFVRGREPELAPLTTTFGAFAYWQRAARTDNALAEEFELLRSDFAGEIAIEIPSDLPRPAIWTSHVETRTRVLDLDATRRYLDDARRSGSTSFMALLAVAAFVLRERSVSKALVITTQVVGRDDVDLEGVVGPFVNSLPLRFDFAESATLAEIVVSVGEMFANALELRHVPYERFAKAILPAPGDDRGAACGINFLYQKAFTQDANYGTFRIESEHSRPGGTSYDLNIYVVERPAGWRLSCDYNPDLFSAETIDSILDSFECTVAAGVDRRKPVIFFHSDLFADGYYADQIAASIDTHRVIPVSPHGVGTRPLLPTIDAMAENYVSTIDTIAPGGPYRLVGFCSGALVAFEVARLLRRRGASVEQVVLINATAPVRPIVPFRDGLIRAIGCNARLSPRVRESLCYNIARFNRALLGGPRTTARFVRNLFGSVVMRRRSAASLTRGETFVRERGNAASELSFAHIAAALSHHPHRYDGPVTLVWSVEQTNLTGDETQGWNRLATSVKTVSMSGGHVAPLHDLVGELSQKLRALL